MTEGALPRFVVSLARGSLGSNMGLEGTWGPVLHPSPPWNGLNMAPLEGPMTRGALPPFVVSLARGATGSCRGLEGTWGPVLHPSLPWNGSNMAPLGGP